MAWPNNWWLFGTNTLKSASVHANVD